MLYINNTKQKGEKKGKNNYITEDDKNERKVAKEKNAKIDEKKKEDASKA